MGVYPITVSLTFRRTLTLTLTKTITRTRTLSMTLITVEFTSQSNVCGSASIPKCVVAVVILNGDDSRVAVSTGRVQVFTPGWITVKVRVKVFIRGRIKVKVKVKVKV